MLMNLKKEECCGCMACGQICPQKCIKFEEDACGFLYPICDESLCVQCGLCEKVCPIINKWEPKNPLQIKACRNKNEEERYRSSSGGVFVLLAKAVILQKGVVFGACYDEDWMVIHSYVEEADGILAFQGSKYVQSRIGETYIEAKKFLDEGRVVLFSGTPCQIAGLKHFLRKDYQNLISVEVLCHGVPSPKVWRDYLNQIQGLNKLDVEKKSLSPSLNTVSLITGISFRDKKNGWRKFNFVVQFSNQSCDGNVSSINSRRDIRDLFSENLYMKGFLSNLTLRPSCFHCLSKGGRSMADLSLGDFWSIDSHCAYFNDNKGTTIVYVNSEKGKKMLETLDIDVVVLDKNIQYNLMYSESCREKYPVSNFWKKYEQEGLHSIISVTRIMSNPLYNRIINKTKQSIRKFVFSICSISMNK